MTTPALDLGSHTGRRYDKGRPVHWQVLWHLASHLVFQKWWFPARFRPALLRAFGARVSDDVVIRQEVRIHWPWKLRIDGPAWIGHGAWILNLDDVVIERDVCLSQEAFLCTGSHDRFDPAFEHTNAPIRLERGSWVCARAVVLPGTVVGAHAVVGAGAVVHGALDPSSRTFATSAGVRESAATVG
ncbi:putative colanic acid biosynthesis acetyltransferase [Pseudonocardia oroxyli]|uniref:Putative colanic acid biosynthesis acetyltransferase WcaF n=1 Tax=Pseudonocardia oroxyli TaxID=366584 RepID=A0A1G7ZBL8_PSEOR|nr:putative colanic acid biosynthesis acetyltransferase [Pseudonocardia oroxyli]SDH05500.1 putative colanic acid biosynthesis acetyltransferase WcaF [Pseudonocardia oroxyli]